MTQTESTFCLPSREQRFKEFMQTPAISWPAVVLLLMGLLVIGVASGMALTVTIPLWVAMLANGKRDIRFYYPVCSFSA